MGSLPLLQGGEDQHFPKMAGCQESLQGIQLLARRVHLYIPKKTFNHSAALERVPLLPREGRGDTLVPAADRPRIEYNQSNKSTVGPTCQPRHTKASSLPPLVQSISDSTTANLSLSPRRAAPPAPPASSLLEQLQQPRMATPPMELRHWGCSSPASLPSLALLLLCFILCRPQRA